MHRVLFSLFDGKITVYTYSVCIVIGLLAGALVFRWLCKRLKMSDTSYDFYSFLAIFTVVVGFVAAYVFQDVYNVLAGRGSNIVKDMQALFAGEGFRMSGGITFMGGLYGKVTNSVFGINYPVNDVWQPRFPTQLYEAAFCFIAFGLMLLLIFKTDKRGFLIAIYAASYSVFRFLVEFLRDDYRGGADIGISPSQVQSIVLILVAAAYVCLKIFWWDKRALPAAADGSENAADGVPTGGGTTLPVANQTQNASSENNAGNASSPENTPGDGNTQS